MIAGWPTNSGFSTSASRAEAKAARSVPQNRHLIAAALIVSAHTGHGLVSSLIRCPRRWKHFSKTVIVCARSMATKRLTASAPLVLVIDDAEDNREVYVQFFEFQGWRTATASDG